MRLRVALVALVAILVVTASPVNAASPETIVHTTPEEFETGSLDNVRTVGSGDSGYLEYTGGTGMVESFENGSLEGYSAGTDGFTIQSVSGATGDNALVDTFDGSGQKQIFTQPAYGTLPAYPARGDTFEVRVRKDLAGEIPKFYFFAESGNTYYSLSMDGRSSRENIQLRAVEGGSATVLDTSENSNTIPDNEWFTLRFTTTDNGGITVELIDDGQVTEEVSVTDTRVNGRGIGFRAGGNSEPIYYDAVEIVETGQIGSYISAPFEADASNGWTDLELSNVSARVEWQADTGSGWTTVDSSNYTSSGNYSVTLPDQYDRFRTSIEFTPTGGNAEARLLEEGVEFTSYDPIATNVTPSDGYTATSESTTFSLNVSDPDFGLSQGDTVTVDLIHEGSVQATTTTSSNGTVTFDEALPSSGEWFFRLTDEYNNTITTESRTIGLPSTLSIYNESSPTQLIDDREVTVRFYLQSGDELVYERTTTNGSVPMVGIPANQPFVAVASTDGYRSRRIFVDSLLETQSIYLLPNGEEYTETIFDVRDYTGRFDGEESVLKVQRALNGTWHTVSADYLGASGEVATQLAYNERHRLIVENVETGARRDLGAFTPTTSGTEVIRVTSSESILDDGQGVEVSIEPTVRSLPAAENSTVSVSLVDPSGSLNDWSVQFVRQNGSTGTNVTLDTVSRTTDGTVERGFNLTDHAGGALFVVVEADTANGTSTATYRFSIREQFDNQHSLISVLGDVPGRFAPGSADGVTTFLAVVLTIIVTTAAAGAVRMSTEIAGLTAVTTLSGFAVLGWVGYGPLFATIVAFMAFAGLRRGI